MKLFSVKTHLLLFKTFVVYFAASLALLLVPAR